MNDETHFLKIRFLISIKVGLAVPASSHYCLLVESLPWSYHISIIAHDTCTQKTMIVNTDCSIGFTSFLKVGSTKLNIWSNVWFKQFDSNIKRVNTLVKFLFKLQS